MRPRELSNSLRCHAIPPRCGSPIWENTMTASALQNLSGRISLVCLALVLPIGCGQEASSLVMETSGASDSVGENELLGEVCAVSCAGKNCGPDGCGGQCGECQMIAETCSGDGLCMPFLCVSSKECPGELVCEEEGGVCVVCVGDEDCPDEQICGPDFSCHEEHPCATDKECKDFDMVCDKVAGICVSCLKSQHCPDGMYCDAGFCLPVICTPETSKCGENEVLACSDDGSRWIAENCSPTQYCDEGECIDFACTPFSTWCDGNVHKVCSDDGKEVLSEEDCAARNMNCIQSGCADGVCAPDDEFCLDDHTLAKCNLEGSAYSSEPCPEAYFCGANACQPQVCAPDTIFCGGNAVTVCDGVGSGYVSEVDCEEKLCVDGQCVDCQPQCSGKSCGPDGCGGACGNCDEGQVCIDGVCPPPGKQCDDGDSVPWDGCTQGEVTEFLVSSEFPVVRSEPGIAVSSEGNILFAWGAHSQTSPGFEVFARLMDSEGKFKGSEFLINPIPDGNQTAPRIVAHNTGGFTVTWSSEVEENAGYGVSGRRVSEEGR